MQAYTFPRDLSGGTDIEKIILQYTTRIILSLVATNRQEYVGPCSPIVNALECEAGVFCVKYPVLVLMGCIT